MKILVLSSTLAAALAGMPVHAADAPVARPVVKPSAVIDAMSSMVHELQAADVAKRPMRERLDALAEFHHGPETAQKLKTVFGSERPWTVARLPVANGRYDYVATLAPLHYTSDAGDTYEWAPLTLKIALDRASRNMTTHGAWPSMIMEDQNVRITMRDFSMATKQKRGFGDIWFGASQMNIASVAFDVKAGGINVALDDIRARGELIERPKAVDLGSTFSIKAISVADEKVDNIKFAMRMTHLDKATMAELKTLGEKANASAQTPEQQIAALQPIFKSLGRAVIQRGAAYEIDELSAAYKGNTASLKGRVTVEGASETELGSLPALIKKIVARFSIRVPVAMVRDISTAVATKQVSAQAKGAPANPQTVAQIAQSMNDIIIGKLLGNGYARLEKEVLVSDIDYRGGVLRINGKQIALPTMHTPQRARSVLQARRIESRCVLPDYPAEVVRAEQPFELSIRFVVKADGKIADLVLVKPSQIPAYDQALLAAMEHCAYMPALVNGQAVDMPTTWRIVSEPGQSRP